MTAILKQGSVEYRHSRLSLSGLSIFEKSNQDAEMAGTLMARVPVNPSQQLALPDFIYVEIAANTHLGAVNIALGVDGTESGAPLL